MSGLVLSLTESQSLAALRIFLLSILPNGMEVIQGQVNRVAEPEGEDFVVFTPIIRERLSTNFVTYTDQGYPSYERRRSDMQSTKMTVQTDVHGPNSADNVQIITSLFSSEIATDSFTDSEVDISPLFTSQPHQAPFMNESMQVETRWSVDLVMQCNPIITVDQDFSVSLNIDVINVDATYPP